MHRLNPITLLALDFSVISHISSVKELCSDCDVQVTVHRDKFL